MHAAGIVSKLICQTDMGRPIMHLSVNRPQPPLQWQIMEAKGWLNNSCDSPGGAGQV